MSPKLQIWRLRKVEPVCLAPRFNLWRFDYQFPVVEYQVLSDEVCGLRLPIYPSVSSSNPAVFFDYYTTHFGLTSPSFAIAWVAYLTSPSLFLASLSPHLPPVHHYTDHRLYDSLLSKSIDLLNAICIQTYSKTYNDAVDWSFWKIFVVKCGTLLLFTIHKRLLDRCLFY